MEGYIISVPGVDFSATGIKLNSIPPITGAQLKYSFISDNYNATSRVLTEFVSGKNLTTIAGSEPTLAPVPAFGDKSAMRFTKSQEGSVDRYLTTTDLALESKKFTLSVVYSKNTPVSTTSAFTHYICSFVNGDKSLHVVGGSAVVNTNRHAGIFTTDGGWKELGNIPFADNLDKRILILRFDLDAGTVKVNYNGVELTMVSGLIFPGVSGSFTLGNNAAKTNGLGGFIARLDLYNGELTNTEVSTAYSFLNGSYSA
jgi:hypothetical protein